MKISSQKNSGLRLAGLLLAIATIGLLVLAGWRVWESSQTQHVSSPAGRQLSNTIESPNDARVDNENYLKIKEQGVKVKLPEAIKDLTYTANLDDKDYPKASFSTKTLGDLSDETCTSDGGAPPLGGVFVTKKSTNQLGSPLAVNNVTIFKLEDTYVLTSPQSPCSTDASVEELASKQRAAFAEALKNIQLDR